MKLKLPKFETVSGNEEWVDWAYVKKTYKEYLKGTDKTLKERMSYQRFMSYQNMIGYFAIGSIYIAYQVNADMNTWVNHNVPMFSFLAQIISTACIFLVGLSFIKDIKRDNRLLKIVDDNPQDREDRL